MSIRLKNKNIKNNKKEGKKNKIKETKGFIFTVDAVFSLIILGIAISALLYFFYESNLAAQTIQISSSSAVQSMLSYKIGDLSKFNLASAMFEPQLQNNTWMEYGGNSNLSFSTQSEGPAIPIVMFAFHAPNYINPSPVVADGMVVFTTAGPSSQLYALNATTGNIIFSASPSSGNFLGTPLIFMNNIYAATSTNTIDAYSSNGVLIWQSSIGTPYLTLEAEDGYIDANSTLIDPENGSIIASAPTKAPSLFTHGEFIQYGLYSPSSGSWEGAIQSYAYYSNSLIPLWHVYNTILASSQAPPQLPSINNYNLNTEFLNCLYIHNIDGTLTSYDCLNKNILGSASILNNKTYVQTSNNLYSIIDSNGAIYFNETLPTSTSFNTTPTTTQNLIYTLLNGNTLVAFDHSGNIIWKVVFKGTPLNKYIEDIPVAYGNIYLPVGRNLYAIGTPKANPQSNLLDVLATLYLNDKGSYATALLNKLPIANETYALFINNTYAPSLDAASFNGYNSIATASYFNEPNPLNTFTILLWIDPSQQQVGNPSIVALGPSPSNDYRLSISTSGAFQSAPLTFSYIDPSGVAHSISSNFYIPANNYSFVAITYNNTNSGTFDWYLNGSLKAIYQNMNAIATANTTLYIGENSTTNPYNGIILDLQIYNKTLTQKQIYNIYKEGISSSPPLNITNSVEGWWPLQGDTNDYTGFHFAYPYNIVYKSVPFIPYNLKNSYIVSSSSMPLTINDGGIEKIFNIGVVEWK
ncbi:MAG: LamG-like jellyroll fold domain-containing protein [Candidatus Micrarchaeia archaeon]